MGWAPGSDLDRRHDAKTAWHASGQGFDGPFFARSIDRSLHLPFSVLSMPRRTVALVGMDESIRWACLQLCW
jgi:hypothetical protein